MPIISPSPTPLQTLHIIGEADVLVQPERSYALADNFPDAGERPLVLGCHLVVGLPHGTGPLALRFGSQILSYNPSLVYGLGWLGWPKMGPSVQLVV